MKSRAYASGINRRVLLATAALLPIPALLRTGPALAQEAGSQLASWNDGPAKQAIIDFVRATTDQASSKFVPPEERIATFDQDGTLWVEHPMYTQLVYCLDRVPAVVAKEPGLKNREPFKTVLSGNREAMAKLSLRDLEEILFATLTGMPVEVFEAKRRNGLKLPNIRVGSGFTPNSLTNRCWKFCNICGQMDTGPTSLPAGAKTLCEFTRNKSMAFLRSRLSARPPAQSMATTGTASRF